MAHGVDLPTHRSQRARGAALGAATGLGIFVCASCGSTDATERAPVNVPRFVQAALDNPAFQWRRRTTTHFQVYAIEGSHADLRLDSVAGAVELERRFVLTRLGETAQNETDRMHVFFLRNPEDFRMLVGQPAGGWTEPDARAVLVAASVTAAPPLRHELAHLFSHILWGAPSADWLSEGVAVFAVGHCAGRPLHQWAAALEVAGMLVPISALEQAFDFTRAAPHLQAGSFITFVAERFGPRAVQALWNGGLRAASAATSLDAPALEAGWRAQLRRQRALAPAGGLDVKGNVRCEGGETADRSAPVQEKR
jgi:hypothetical protein